MRSPIRQHILPLGVFIFLSLSAGFVSAFFTANAIPTWYEALQKPALNPPAWLFAPVWTILYILIGTSAFLVWKQVTPRKAIRTALRVFYIQLILNALWSILFFGLKRPDVAFGEILLLWGSILATMFLFSKRSSATLFLLLPYLAWVSFAAYLNYQIWMLN
ncbi:tryptophan-rich sensory protein [Candidatus Uhrbacteria bacterium]|nr:tryptophan-rich sensory protein [Candidatus Uhrbacteria bacterium]